MKLLIVTNYNHKVSKLLIEYLKLKVNFDHIDSSKKKIIKIKKKYDYLISFLNSKYIDKNVRKKTKKNSFNFHPGHPNTLVLDVTILLYLISQVIMEPPFI